jgi:hypothetical protein
MDRKTGRPIISLKFKAPAPTESEPVAEKTVVPARKPEVSGREPFVMPKVPSRKHGVREVVVAKPAPAVQPAPARKQPEETKPAPIPPPAFKAATKAATQAVAAVLADPAWQSADLLQSYQEAKLRARPIHRKQAKLISGIVLKRLAADSADEELRSLAMRAAYAAAFSSLIASVSETTDALPE